MLSKLRVLEKIKKINSGEISFTGVSKTFCLAPFTTLYMGAAGENRFCCISKNRSLGQEMDIPRNIMKDVWTSKYYRDVRNKMVAGKFIEECKKCYEIEKNGGKSDRQFFNEVTAGDVPDLKINCENGNHKGTPIVLDVRPSNLCNLKCRMCDSNSSSGIAEEYKKHQELDILFKGLPRTPLIDWFSENDMFVQIQDIVKNCYKLKLLGGEPVILKSVYNLLKWCVEKDYHKEIVLDITSNVFVLRDDFYEVLSYFNTWLHISIDGVGKVNDYIRYPSRWQSTLDNIKRLLAMSLQERASIHLKLLATVNIYNIYNVDEIIKWWSKLPDPNGRKEEILFNIIFSPEHLKIDLLPENAREKAIYKLEKSLTDSELSDDFRYKSRLEYVIQKLKSDSFKYVDKSELELFIKSTAAYDKVRGQNIKEDLPELYDVFKDDFLYYSKK